MAIIADESDQGYVSYSGRSNGLISSKEEALELCELAASPAPLSVFVLATIEDAAMGSHSKLEEECRKLPKNERHSDARSRKGGFESQ